MSVMCMITISCIVIFLLFGFQWTLVTYSLALLSFRNFRSFLKSFWSLGASWAQVDSNYRPRAYQARALTCWAMSPFGWELLSVCLPATFMEMMGFEPMTPCLQGRCSPNWATPPWCPHLLLQWAAFLKLTQNWTTLTSTPIWMDVISFQPFSLERRWSSRTFRYGYLVTT